VPFYEFGEGGVFPLDGAPEEIAARRRAGFMRWRSSTRSASREAPADGASARGHLRSAVHRRLPRAVQYSRIVREHLGTGSVRAGVGGVMLADLDGNRFYDLTGSYGVNVFGYDFYKECMDKGYERVRDLGPVLGAYHPSSPITSSG